MTDLKNTIIQDNEGIKVPRGSTADRPGRAGGANANTPAVQGMIRYNTDFGFTEYYDGTTWKPMDDSVIAWGTGADVVKIGNEVAMIWRDVGVHNFRCEFGGNVRVLVVGGGGSGGGSGSNCSAGGGGAGGFVETTVTEANESNTTITVGKGGIGGNPGSDGGGDNSFLGRDGSTSSYGAIQGLGGGGGGGGQSRVNGRNGGSAGGGAHPGGVGGSAQQPGSTYGGFGGNGGNATPVNPEWGGGGGGGAGEQGQTGNSNWGGMGGSGRMSGITGTMKWYAGGGGGGGCQQSGSRTRGVHQFSGQGTASGTNAGEGGLGGGGSANQQWSNDFIQHRYQQGRGGYNTGGGGAAGSYNSGGTRSGDGGTGIVVARFRSRVVEIGTIDKPAQNGVQIKAYNPDAPSGLYYIKPDGWTGAAQQIYVDMDHHGGGWMLVSSNYSQWSDIPSGNSRHSTDYELNRGGLGPLGTPDPNRDYIIGAIIDDIPFSAVRVWGFGHGSTNGTYTWPYNLGKDVVALWGLTTSGVNRQTEVRLRWDGLVRVEGVTGLGSAAQYFSLDGIRQDRLNGGYSANSNQTTIGGIGANGASGDPTTGTYLGHGTNENNGSFEGWYDSHNNRPDCDGYTTWVK